MSAGQGLSRQGRRGGRGAMSAVVVDARLYAIGGNDGRPAAPPRPASLAEIRKKGLGRRLKEGLGRRLKEGLGRGRGRSLCLGCSCTAAKAVCS
jgi:hypothetical protein